MIDTKLISFMCVASTGNFTKAAEKLNLTQPAVTQHIKMLEEFYGVKLFMKKGKYFALTSEGEFLNTFVKELHANVTIFDRMMKNHIGFTKEYCIGATLTIGEFFLPHLLGEYKSLNENIDIIMQVFNMDGVLKKLTDGEIDLGIVEGPFDKLKFNYKKLKDDELVLTVAYNSQLAQNKSLGIEDILSGKLILREKGSGTRIVFENKLLDLGFNLSELKPYMEIGSLGAIKSLVEENLGYTVISREAVRKEVKEKKLKIVPIRGVKIMREFNFIYGNRSLDKTIEDFMEFLIMRSSK